MKAAVLSAGGAVIPSADDSDCGFQIVDCGFVIDMMTLFIVWASQDRDHSPRGPHSPQSISRRKGGKTMETNTLTISYPDDLLLSLKETRKEFEQQAWLLLAIKLYELSKISTGMAARLAGMGRVAFMLELGRFGLSPISTTPEELVEDVANA